MKQSIIYQNYSKPPLSPPPYLFGIVWSILYVIIFVSYGYVFYKAIKGEISWQVTIPFLINLLANFSYTYIQFRIQNLPLATVDIFIVLATIIISMIIIWPHYKWVTYAQIPYLLWVLFATYLQIGVTLLNK